MISDYYALTKSGLIFGTLITVIAGFLLGSTGTIHLWLLITTLVGIFFVIASGCVFNNYIDRDIDRLMQRTKGRALATGRISGHAALTYGAILGAIGFCTLIIGTNLLAAGIAAVGFFFYVFMYTLWFKRRSVYGTVIGSISGAVPPLVGYCAASNRFDAAAGILFLILAVWQMPHFFAIAIYRFSDYAAAGIPVLPVKRGIRATKIAMFIYIIAFILITPLLTIGGYTGMTYLAIALFLGVAWLVLCLRGFRVSDGAAADARWARQMFFSSLFVMVILFAAIALEKLI